MTAWLLVCIAVARARLANTDAQGIPVRLTEFWAGRMGSLYDPIRITLAILAPLVLILLITSLGALSTARVRSASWIFRVPLGGTIALTMVTAAFVMLGYLNILVSSFD